MDRTDSASDLPGRELARLGASRPRRMMGMVVLGGLALMLLWLGATLPQPGPWQLVFLAAGILFGAGALALWRATAVDLVLTETGLFDTDGRALARMDQIRGVDRGFFAIRPSNGFVLSLREAPGRAWAPGLYWRLGRRIGVGGVTRAAEGKAMADILAIYMAERG